MPFHFLLKGTSNGMFLRHQPFKNITASECHLLVTADSLKILQPYHLNELLSWAVAAPYLTAALSWKASQKLFISVYAVNIQPGSVLLSWLLGCQMKAFLGEFWVPYWEEKLQSAIWKLPFYAFWFELTCSLQCFDLFQSCMWNCSFLESG